MKQKIKIKNSLTVFIIVAFFCLTKIALAAPEDIIITEIMYNLPGSDSKKEWIEILNIGPEPVEIIEGSGNDSWRFNDGSNHIFTLEHGSLTIPSGGYAIIASNAQTFINEHPNFDGTVIDTVMSLNNTSGTIKLSKNSGENFFSSVTYNNTQGADGDGKSLQYYNGSWAALAPTPSKTASEAPQDGTQDDDKSRESDTSKSDTADSQSIDASDQHAYQEKTINDARADASKIKITEIFPNPKGNEITEFIELWNNQEFSISLDGFKLSDATKVIELKNITLVPGEYRAIYRSETKIALNNTNETVYLYDTQGNLIDQIKYSSTIEGYSLSYNIKEDKFSWTSTKTPSKENKFTLPNDPPIPIIKFSNNPVAPNEAFTAFADESEDPDGDALSYLWKIGGSFEANGSRIQYSFPKSGTYVINVFISDPTHTVHATSSIKVIPSKEVVYLRSEKAKNSDYKKTDNKISSNAKTSAQIFITEVLPNPQGRDDGEWVELYNPNNFDVILNKWTIDDEEGGSKPHKIKDRIIRAKSYLVIGKEETRVTFNNSSDEVRIFNADEKLIDYILYDDAREAESYNKSDDGLWFWSSGTTPGEKNISTKTPSESFQPNLDYMPAIAAPTDYDIVDIDLPNIRELEIGTRVRVQGKVAVEPGILGKTYFYLTGSQGVQIYFYKKNWPLLKTGDVIGVIGEISEAYGETRIKVASKQDIVHLYKSEPPKPTELRTGDINESYEGSLLSLKGQIVQKKSSSWYIDDGSGESRVVFQQTANIKKPKVMPGDWVQIIGIISETKSGYRVLPRYTEDVSIIDKNDIEQKVLGAKASAGDIQRFVIPPNNRAQKIFIYLLVTSIALIALLSVLLIKLKIETKKRIKALEEKYGKHFNIKE